MLKRIAATFMAFVLALGLSIPTPALALEPAAFSAGITVAEGTINQEDAKVIIRTEVKKALDNWIDNWNEEKSSIKVNTFEMPKVEGDEGDFLQRTVSEFLKESGQYFFVVWWRNTHYTTYTESGSDKVKVTITIPIDNEDFSKDDVEVFNNKVNEVLAGVDASWPAEQKLLYLHDYIVTHCQYGELVNVTEGGSTFQAAAHDWEYTSYGALVKGSAVCQGYSSLYDYLLERLGIDSQLISSDAINHTWNLITLENEETHVGETFYVDCTWDDPVGARSETYCQHENFLRTQNGMIKTEHTSKDWRDSFGSEAYDKYGTSTKYENAYWMDVETEIPQIGNKCAYVHKTKENSKATATVYIHDYAAESAPNVTGSDDKPLIPGLAARWFAIGQDSYYPGHYNVLAANGTPTTATQFIATTPTEIYFINPDGTIADVRAIGSAEQAMGLIYGLVYDQGSSDWKCCLAATPNGGSVKARSGVSSLATPDKASKNLAIASASLSKSSLEYNENDEGVNVPKVTANYLGKELRAGTDYSILYTTSAGSVPKPYNVGSYTVRLIGLGAFAGTSKPAGTFTIAKASNELWSDFSKVTKKYKRKKLKKAKTFALPMLQADFGEENAKWRVVSGNKKSKKVLKLKGNKIQVKKKAKKGTYTIKLQASVPGTANYAAAKLAKPVTIKVKVK